MTLAPWPAVPPLDQIVRLDADAAAALDMAAPWAVLDAAARDGQQSCLADMAALGANLGQAFFAPGTEAAAVLVDNLATAQAENRSLRLLFEGHAATLPIEFVQLPDELLETCSERGIVVRDAALALHDRVEILRAPSQLSASGQRVEVTRTEPLRILIAVANPATAQWPNIPRAEPQAKIIEAACQGIGGDFVDVTLLSGSSPARLTEALREQAPHIVHFVGHGARELPRERPASLVLHADSGAGASLMAAGDLLATGAPLPELVSLNACHLGGNSAAGDGFAQTLSAAGVSLVLAMQLPVIDVVAEHIAESVYRPFLRGLPLASALASVRRQIAVDNRRRQYPEWATPALYTRVTDTSRFAGVPPVGISEARSRVSASRFVGREWLWSDVQRQIDAAQPQVGLLVADAGMGKSSFIGLCERRLADAAASDPAAPCVISYRYHYGERADATACARSLTGQLRRWLSDRNEEPPAEPPPDARVSAYVRECSLLMDALRAAAAHSRVVLLLDALDEASDAGDALPVAEWLNELPDNLHVFVTARPEWYAAWRLRYPGKAAADDPADDPRFAPVTLEPMSEANLRDVAFYLHRTLGGYGIMFTPGECLGLARAIEGSFLVADILCGLLRSGDDKARVTQRFEQADSVTEAYDLVFRTLAAELGGTADAEPGTEDVDDLLALVTLARDPLTEEQLVTLFEARDAGRQADLATALGHLRPYLDIAMNEYGEQTYRAYHQSLRAYGERRMGLGSSEQDTGKPLPRSWQTYARLWANYCLRWGELQRYPRVYALRHVVPHLIAVQDDASRAAVDSVLTDYAYIAAALGADPANPERPLDVDALIAHYDAAGEL